MKKSCLTCKFSTINNKNIMLSRCNKVEYYINEKIENPLCIGSRTNEKWCGHFADWWEPFDIKKEELNIIENIEAFRMKYSK